MGVGTSRVGGTVGTDDARGVRVGSGRAGAEGRGVTVGFEVSPCPHATATATASRQSAIGLPVAEVWIAARYGRRFIAAPRPLGVWCAVPHLSKPRSCSRLVRHRARPSIRTAEAAALLGVNGSFGDLEHRNRYDLPRSSRIPRPDDRLLASSVEGAIFCQGERLPETRQRLRGILRWPLDSSPDWAGHLMTGWLRCVWRRTLPEMDCRFRGNDGGGLRQPRFR